MKTIVVSMLVALMALAMLPATAEVIQNEKIPVYRTVVNPCTGEEIDLAGDNHLLVSYTEDNAGGQHYKIQESLKLFWRGD